MLSDDFYRALEERFRGTKETIKVRQSVYLPVVEALHAKLGKGALDVGCGRGEWLELLTEHGVPAEGIDLNEEFVDVGKAAGLAVKKADAMQFLASQPDGAYELVSAFHVVEHLGFDNLLAFLKEAYRVVDDDGAILLETPNPANLVVGACNFYIDPTHERPIPSVLLGFAAEYSGFQSVIVVPVNRGFIQNDLELMPAQLAGATVINKAISALDTNLMQAPDYAVVAFKKRDDKLVELAESLVSVSQLPISPKEEETVDALNVTVTEAQRAVREWQERAHEAEIRIRELELRASDAILQAREHELKASDAILQAREHELRASEAMLRTRELELKTSESKVRDRDFELEASEAILRVRDLELKANEAMLRVRDLELKESEAKLQDRNLELEASEVKLHAEGEMRRIEQRAAAAEMEINRLHHHIHAIYRSRSWRLAAPLRWGGEALRNLGISRTGAKRVAKPILMHAAAYVRCRPVLKERISSMLSRFPKLRSRLVGVIGVDVIRGDAPALSDDVDSVERLTARGRKVYADLIKAKDSDTP